MAVGSLSLRRSPCIREHCALCKSGERHVSYALYGRQRGRRFSIYIPDEIAPLSNKRFTTADSCSRLWRKPGDGTLKLRRLNDI